MSLSPLAQSLLAGAAVFVGGIIVYVVGAPQEFVFGIFIAVLLLGVAANNRNGSPE